MSENFKNGASNAERNINKDEEIRGTGTGYSEDIEGEPGYLDLDLELDSALENVLAEKPVSAENAPEGMEVVGSAESDIPNPDFLRGHIGKENAGSPSIAPSNSGEDEGGSGIKERLSKMPTYGEIEKGGKDPDPSTAGTFTKAVQKANEYIESETNTPAIVRKKRGIGNNVSAGSEEPVVDRVRDLAVDEKALGEEEKIVAADSTGTGDSAASEPDRVEESIEEGPVSNSKNDNIAASNANVEPAPEVEEEPAPADEPGFVLGKKVEFIDEPFPYEKLHHWQIKDGFTDVPSPDFDVVITQDVLIGVNRHVAETLDCELGGFLLGNRYHCSIRKRDYIKIDLFEKAESAPSDEVSLDFTPNVWVGLQNKLDGKYRGHKQLVGWYHSHPKMQVFLSEPDVNVHKSHFSWNRWAVALVIEPDKRYGGFFSWRWDNKNDPLGEKKEIHPKARINFYEEQDVSREEHYMIWREYICHDPETGKERVHVKEGDISLPVPVPLPPPQPPVDKKPEIKILQVSEPWDRKKVVILAALIIVVLGGIGALLARKSAWPFGGGGAGENSNILVQKSPLSVEPPSNTIVPDPRKASPVKTRRVNTTNNKNYLFLSFNEDVDPNLYEVTVDARGVEPVSSDVVLREKGRKLLDPTFSEYLEDAEKDKTLWQVYKLMKPVKEETLMIELKNKGTKEVVYSKNYEVNKPEEKITPDPAPPPSTSTNPPRTKPGTGGRSEPTSTRTTTPELKGSRRRR